jgi:GNAT superfamily N-acetyltransferase
MLFYYGGYFMIVSYQTGAEFLQDNQAYLQTDPYLSTFFTLDAPLLKEAGKINYALRCEQGDKRLLALKVEPYNLLLFGEEAFVPELLRFLFDGGYEIKNYLCASELFQMQCELGYALMRELEPYGRRYEEALAMDFMEARSVTEPSAPEVETAHEDDLDEIFDCAQRFVADCGLLDKPEKEPFRKVLGSFRVIRADGKIVSMARIAPATKDDLRLVLVYTRDEYRGKGYARKVVNSAKNEILASGKRVTLNVDRKNPISYHLYLSLGFERVFSQGEFRRVE